METNYQVAQKVNEQFFMRKLRNELALQQWDHFQKALNEFRPIRINLDGIPGHSRILLLREIIQAIGEKFIEKKLKVIVIYIINGISIEYLHSPAIMGAPGNVYCPEMGEYQSRIKPMLQEITTSAGYVLFEA
jgi:hypothetical protein